MSESIHIVITLVFSVIAWMFFLSQSSFVVQSQEINSKVPNKQVQVSALQNAAPGGSGGNHRRHREIRNTNYVIPPIRLRQKRITSGATSRIGFSNGQARDVLSRKKSKPRTPSAFRRSRNNSEVVKRLERLFLQVPTLQETTNSLRSSFGKQRQRSRAEHRRLWRDIFNINGEISKLQTNAETLMKNLTSISKQVNRRKSVINSYPSDVVNKIQQIENHQESQDSQYFVMFESVLNNSAAISELQASVDTFNDLYENLNTESEYADIPESGVSTRSYDHCPEIVKIQSELLAQQTLFDDFTNTVEKKLESISQNQFTPNLEGNHRTIIQEMIPPRNIESNAVADIQDTVNSHSEDIKLFSNKMEGYKTKIDENSVLTKSLSERVTRFEQRTNQLQDMIEIAQNWTSATEHQSTSNEVGNGHKFDQVTQAVRQQNSQLVNLTRSMRKTSEDVRYLSMITFNYVSIVNEQSRVIQKQNESIVLLKRKNEEQASRVKQMETEVEYQHETVMKLMTIVTNLAHQIRRPIPQYKDCHDLWMNGHTKSGVYTLIRDMSTFHVYCNMTDKGGWTVIQRRNDGTQDFDRNWPDYRDGFGSVYGEYWLGLDVIRWLTHGRMYTLMVVLEDWAENQRYAIYNKFIVLGQDYILTVSGYAGDAGDSMSENNGHVFKVRQQDRHTTYSSGTDCITSRKAGWWFSSNCGDANPNGPYFNDPIAALTSEASDTTADALSQLRWMTWRGEDYPLKKISMQILPREALVENIFSTLQSNDGFQDIHKNEDRAADRKSRDFDDVP